MIKKQHMCGNCEDSGVVPAGDFANGDTCPECEGDPLNALPHDQRPHPPDYDCPDCRVSSIMDTTPSNRDKVEK